MGSYSALLQFKNEQKFLKMVYIILNCLIVHFGVNVMEIQAKIFKLQMHELYANFPKYL